MSLRLVRRGMLRHPLAFSLVELIIVILVVAILAALAIPQISDVSEDAKHSALKSNLTTLRAAIERYAREHNGALPGAKKDTGGGQTDDADNPAAFVRQLTRYSKGSGEVSESRVSPYTYGPYLSHFPENPHATVADKTSVVVTEDAGTITADAAPTAAWKYSKVTGKIIANVAAYQDW